MYGLRQNYIPRTSSGDNNLESRQARVMSIVWSVPDFLDLHPYKGPSKYLELFWSYGIYIEICEKINKNTYISKNAFFTKKLGTI